jgi:hypothetical protein
MNHERGPRDRGQGASVGGAHPSLTGWLLFDTSLASAALLILNSLSNRICNCFAFRGVNSLLQYLAESTVVACLHT